jgi:multicomponent Na+:H+ antiporter subunit C
MGIAMMASGVNLFLVALGYRAGGNAPIYTDVPEGPMVLPVPQALTLTSIVINVAVLALMLTIVIRIYRHTGSLDSEKSRKLKG